MYLTGVIDMEEQQVQQAKPKRNYGMLISILAGISVAVIFLQFWSLAVVSGESMTNTFQDGDKLIYAKKVDITYGDIVVCKSDTWNHILIKRVIGMSGDTIDIDFETGTVIRNGEPLQEDYLKEKPFLPLKEIPDVQVTEVTYPVTVPEGCYMVMGDNRNGSVDSRTEEIGFIPESGMYGKVILRYAPDITKFD